MKRKVLKTRRSPKSRGQLIADLNHHIRNALEIIALSFAERDELQRLRLVKEAAERIDRVLKRFSQEGGAE